MHLKVQEIDEREFDEIVADKRHKELRTALKIIADALSQKSDEAVLAALEKNADAIKYFATAIKQNNYNNLEKIGNDILKGQEDIVVELKKMHEWSFTFDRMDGYIQSPVIAKQIK